MYFPLPAQLPSPIVTCSPREIASGHGLEGSCSRTCHLHSLLGTSLCSVCSPTRCSSQWRRVCGERAVTAMSPVQVSYSKSRPLSQQINTFVTTVYYFFIDSVQSNKSFPLERFGVLVFHRSLSLSCCTYLLNPIYCIPFGFPWADMAFTCLMIPFAGTLSAFLCNHVQKPNNLLS